RLVVACLVPGPPGRSGVRDRLHGRERPGDHDGLDGLHGLLRGHVSPWSSGGVPPARRNHALARPRDGDRPGGDSDRGDTATRRSVLYSDSVQQAWAVAFGMVDAPRAGTLAGYFNAVQPNWAKPLATALFDLGIQNVGYWPVAGLALMLVGNVAGALGATTIPAAAVSSSRPRPSPTAS